MLSITPIRTVSELIKQRPASRRPANRAFKWIYLCCVLAILGPGGAAAAQNAGRRVIVDSAPSHAVNTFSPMRALGAGVDRLRPGAADKLLTGPYLKDVLSAGWQPVSYRQNTELHVEAWHWNPKGTWSDPSGRGYFTGDAEPLEMIRHSYAYPLPRRGFTRNSGTERGYSRLTDGNLDTFWKSNPYLTQAFTGEDDLLHPQWVTLDLGEKFEIDAVRIAWAELYARSYRVQFWTGENNPVNAPTKGIWQTFPLGTVTEGRGGTVTIPLASGPILVRYLRIWMTASSNTCDNHDPADRRDSAGFAIRELYAGTLAADGGFQDLTSHFPDGRQTATLCSSVDPWHAASDLDEKLGDQVGFDLFYTCGVTRGLPAMVPVAMIYSTPEDAAAEIAYLEKRGYPISYVEMGEEPDGQYMLPEDYGALYLQFASAIHRVDPALKLGGPSFQGVNSDVEVWPDAEGRVSWLGRFIDYLKAHGRLNDLAFLSFEHYPYEPCDIPWNALYDEPRLISRIIEVWKDDGLPPDVPMFVTEVNLSWQSGVSFVDIMGGLWFADYTGAFLTAGGNASYYFHYMPSPLRAGCNDSWGTFGLFNVDVDYRVKGRHAQYFASQLVSREWVQPVDAAHRVFRASSDARDASGNVLVTAYAVERPDGQWSLLLINKDRENVQTVRIVFHDPDAKSNRFLSGPVDLITFGAGQYEWYADGAQGYADPDGPPVRARTVGGAETEYALPKASITVIRGKVGSIVVSFADLGNQDDAYYEKKRKAMVEMQLQARDITDPRVLDAMGKVPRHLFVDPPFRPEAYEDYPLSIAEGQTISQPYIVALMTQRLKLKGEEKVLEVGTGSGYQAAVLAHLADRVYTIEINPALAKKAGDFLSQLGYERIEVKCGDGFFGWPDKAPFDAIIVTCAARQVPEPLFDQLREGGRMIIPVDETEGVQTLLAVRKVKGRMETEDVTLVRFVPMTGENRKIKE